MVLGLKGLLEGMWNNPSLCRKKKIFWGNMYHIIV